MENMLAVGSYPFPCVCLSCGAWYTRESNSSCPNCGQFPTPATRSFYEWCLSIEKDFRPWDKRLLKAFAGNAELCHGWSDTFLALLSAIGLGILSNASYDIIKAWLLMKKEEFLKNRFVADYDTLVRLVVDYLDRNPHLIKEFNFNNDELVIKFNQSIKPLIGVVEQKAKIEEELKE